ncbi:MAG: hypothetical protein HN350_01330 [Phycisphaerales bacterium]|jgi:hypothetical protein|nr:hypothetical protein [Phycisphaerales bacterium]
MRICAIILSVMTFVASVGLGDTVSVGRLPYSNVTITAAEDGTITFKTAGGRSQTKSFADITGILITGLDEFNEAEKLISGSGKSETVKLRKSIEDLGDKIAEIKAKIADVPGEQKRLRESADRIKKQADVYKTNAAEINKQLSELRKIDQALKSKGAKLKAEAKKMMNKARTLSRGNKQKQDQAKQLVNRAKQLLKEAAALDSAGLKASAKQKRLAAQGKRNEAAKIIREKRKDWQKHRDNKGKEYKKLIAEAEGYEKQAKRLADAEARRRTEKAKLGVQISALLSQEKSARKEILKLTREADDFPKVAKAQQEKLGEFVLDLDAKKAKLDQLAGGSQGPSREYAKAIRLYGSAMSQNVTPTQKKVISYRLLNTLEKAGWIDEAATLWLKLAALDKGSDGVIRCRPSKPAPKGDARNAKAIANLKASLSTIRKSPHYSPTLELLARIMLQEGKFADVVTLLSFAKDPNLKVMKAQGMLGMKNYTQAVTVVTDALGRLEHESLSEAMMTRGQALWGQSASITDKKKKEKMMRDAVLDFMRVGTYFPGTPRAGQSLYSTGKIMVSLPVRPNPRAAKKLFQFVSRAYAGTPIGKAAEAELKKLNA